MIFLAGTRSIQGHLPCGEFPKLGCAFNYPGVFLKMKMQKINHKRLWFSRSGVESGNNIFLTLAQDILIYSENENHDSGPLFPPFYWHNSLHWLQFANMVSEYMLSDGLMCSFLGGLVSSSEREPDSWWPMTGWRLGKFRKGEFL